MAERNQTLWRGIRPTDPAENIPVDIKVHSVNTPIIPSSPEQILTRYEVPYGTTHVQAYGSVTAGANTIYTVPASKVLHVVSFGLSVYPNGAAGYGYITQRNSIGTGLTMFSYLDCLTDDGKSQTGCLPIALQLVATDYIEVVSQNATTVVWGWIIGYTRSV